MITLNRILGKRKILKYYLLHRFPRDIQFIYINTYFSINLDNLIASIKNNWIHMLTLLSQGEYKNLKWFLEPNQVLYIHTHTHTHIKAFCPNIGSYTRPCWTYKFIWPKNPPNLFFGHISLFHGLLFCQLHSLGQTFG